MQHQPPVRVTDRITDFAQQGDDCLAIGTSRGNNNPPSDKRTKASVTVRTARLVGSRMRPLGSSSLPNIRRRPAASESAKLRWAGIVKTLAIDKRGLGILDRLRSADVEPQPLVHRPEASTRFDRAIPQDVG